MGLEAGSSGRACYSSRNSVSPKRCTASFDEDRDSLPIMAIPERDRRLISVLMQKRHQDRLHLELVDRFHRLWSQEKEEREMRVSEATASYERYLSDKRRRERRGLDTLRVLSAREQQTRRRRLLDAIAAKEQRAADVLASKDDVKHSGLIQRSTEHQSREALAAWRRTLDASAAEERRLLALAHALEKEEQAERRRREKLMEVSQKLALTSALSTWGSMHVRQRRRDLDALKQASTEARVAITDAKAASVLLAKSHRQDQARKLANYTALLRKSIKEETRL